MIAIGKYIYFDENGYRRALTKSLETVFDATNKRVYVCIIANLASLKIVHKDTPFAGNIASCLRHARKKTLGEITASFGAGGDAKPNQTFRAVYYEYGTGTKMQPPAGWQPDEYWNDNRPKGVRVPLYTRKKGLWEDVGGNLHISKYVGKPRPLAGKAVKEREVEPHFWFRDGFVKGTEGFEQALQEAVKSVPILSYIKIRDIKARM